MGEHGNQTNHFGTRILAACKQFFAYWKTEHDKVFHAFADQSSVTSQHSFAQHVQELRAYYNKHIHLGSILRAKWVVFGLTGLKMLVTHTAFGHALGYAVTGAKLLIVNVLFKSVLVNYLLFLLVMLGLNPQFALVSDISDSCISESLFETCMQQPDASQEVCLVQAMQGECATTTEDAPADGSIEQLIAQSITDGVIMQTTDGVTEIIVNNAETTEEIGAEEAEEADDEPEVVVVNELRISDDTTVGASTGDVLTGESSDSLSSAVVGTTDTGTSVMLGNEAIENEKVEIEQPQVCTTEVLLPGEATSWNIVSISLQGNKYQVPNEQKLETLATFITEMGKAVDMYMETTLVDTGDTLTLAIQGDLYGLEKIDFVDGFGENYSFIFSVDCHERYDACMNYCSTYEKRMQKINNRQSCEVYCGLAEPGSHTVAETGTMEENTDNVGAEHEHEDENTDPSSDHDHTDVHSHEKDDKKDIQAEVLSSSQVDTATTVSGINTLISVEKNESNNIQKGKSEKIDTFPKSDDKNKDKKNKVIQPISNTDTQHSEQVCTEQLNLTCLSKCIMVGGNPLSCKVACSKTICEETITPEIDEKKDTKDKFIVLTNIESEDLDLCHTNSDCLASCLASGKNPIACKNQCTTCKDTSKDKKDNKTNKKDTDDFTDQEKERLCSGKEFGACMQGCLEKGKENRLCHTVCSRCEQEFIVTDGFDVEQQALFETIMDPVINIEGETIGVTFTAPIAFAVSEVPTSRAVISEGTTITTKDSVPLTLSDIHTSSLSRENLVSEDAPENLIAGFAGGMHFGTENTTLYFDKPVAITFPVNGRADGDLVDIAIHHAGEPFGIRGLTTNPNSLCLNGESSDIGYSVPVVNGEVTIYTCSASHTMGHTTGTYFCMTDGAGWTRTSCSGTGGCSCNGEAGRCFGRCQNSPYNVCNEPGDCSGNPCLDLALCVPSATCTTHQDCGPGTCLMGSCTNCPTQCGPGTCGAMVGTGFYDRDDNGDGITGAGLSGMCSRGEIFNVSYSAGSHEYSWNCGTGSNTGDQVSCGPLYERRCGDTIITTGSEQCDSIYDTGQAQCATGLTCVDCNCGVPTTGVCGSIHSGYIYDADGGGNGLTGGSSGLCLTGTLSASGVIWGGTGYNRWGWRCDGLYGATGASCGAFQLMCGDGILTTTGGAEQCDDGNTGSSDGCSWSGCDYEDLYYCNMEFNNTQAFSWTSCPVLGDACVACGSNGTCAGRCSAGADNPYEVCREDGQCPNGTCDPLALCVAGVDCRTNGDGDCGNGYCDGNVCVCPTCGGPGICGPFNGSGIYDANNSGDSSAISGENANLCTSGEIANYAYSGTTHTWYRSCGTGAVSGDQKSCSAPERWCGDTILQTGGGEQCDTSAVGCTGNNNICNGSCACVEAATGYCGSLSGTYVYDANNSGDGLSGGAAGLCGTGTVTGFAYSTTGHTWSWTCAGIGGYGNAICRANEEYCSNGSTGNAGGNEECDDGNQTSSDGCSYPGCDWDPVSCDLVAAPVPQVITGSVGFTLNNQASYEKVSQLDYGDGVTGSSISPHTYSSTGTFVAAATIYHSGNPNLTDVCTDMVIIYSGALATGCRLFSGEEMASTFTAGPPTQVSLQGIDEQWADLTGGGAVIIETTVVIRSSTGAILHSGTGNVNFSQSISTGAMPITVTTTIIYRYGTTYHKITSTRVLGSSTPNDTGTSGYTMPFYCEDLTYCGDSATQNPNQIGLLGASGTGDEQCDDGANGIGSDGCNDYCKTSTNGSCGAKHGTGYYDSNNGGDGLTGGSTGLCTTGTVTSFTYVTGSHSRTWTCAGTNSGSNASCNATELWCGDAITGSAPQEYCDRGTGNGVSCTPPYGTGCSYCNSTCGFTNLEGGECGDGTTDSPDEQCDDGNSNNNDGCSYSGCDFETPTCSINAASGTINSGQTNTYTITVNTGWIGFTSLNFGNGNTITPSTLNTGTLVYTSSYVSGLYTITLTIYNAYSGGAGSGMTNTCSTNITVTDCHDDDGDGQTNCAGDCDDTNNARYSGNAEICDLYDNDCDSSTNEGISCCEHSGPPTLDFGSFSWSTSSQDKTASYVGGSYFTVTDYPYGCSGFNFEVRVSNMSGMNTYIASGALDITQSAGLATFLAGSAPDAYKTLQSNAALSTNRGIMSRTGTNIATYVQYGVQPTYEVTIPGNTPVGAYTGTYTMTHTYGL